MSERILAAMETAEQKAWDALARYKFYMFGYHAAQWVNLNRIGEFKRENPFGDLVKMARGYRPMPITATSSIELPSSIAEQGSLL
ncbi:MAG: hypothetical protein E5X23_09770 [Mesorhizobium sp.]|nr:MULTISPECIES: hypothetical protein [unclassified Mesorhizobium]MCT2580516.1 hypothetical protein [Mesorhizobium sp. P13.3]MDF3169458.1 hypothetical protein [Mesorhizobium sp. P16.1]MDF3178880.1 hypothetical protein [Mesorhizobium sp. P17.1]MDF3186373.1 hypothetical protein [Mesorhizobium sp. ICCV3110.1]RUV63682.1 hypothetical protein EOA64_08290 [Mesorhizobium sp. M1A.F.Ca.IN.022.02.1.1]